MAMGLLSPNRRFVDPSNTEGIPKVRPRWPVPVRDKPLTGTKRMHTPNDGSLAEVIHRRIEHVEIPSRAAQVLGYLAIAGVLGFWCLLWFIWRRPDVDLYSHGGLFTALVIVGLGGIHAFAIFSQILSHGRNMPGSLSMILLYVGSMVLAVVDHLTQ